MDCKKVEETRYLFFDEQLEDGLLSRIREHLSHCPPCARRLEFTRRMMIVVRSRCVRQAAPKRLRVRILTSLPHRKGDSQERMPLQ